MFSLLDLPICLIQHEFLELVPNMDLYILSLTCSSIQRLIKNYKLLKRNVFFGKHEYKFISFMMKELERLNLNDLRIKMEEYQECDFEGWGPSLTCCQKIVKNLQDSTDKYDITAVSVITPLIEELRVLDSNFKSEKYYFPDSYNASRTHILLYLKNYLTSPPAPHRLPSVIKVIHGAPCGRHTYRAPLFFIPMWKWMDISNYKRVMTYPTYPELSECQLYNECILNHLTLNDLEY